MFAASTYEELVDICRDKAVAISDQCFANYILKHVFVDKKTISLAQMLDTCFQTYRKRTIQTVNTLLGVFQSQDVYDFTIHEIKVVWKKRKSESFNKYWDWVKAFYQVDQVETLLLIKERIDNTEKVELSVDEIDVNEGKNYQSVDDELIVILGGFADTHNIESALDLFFDYYLKRPDIISTLFTLLSPEEVKTIIHNAPSETVDFWLFAYYCEIPSEAIDTAKVEELYAYLKCDYDREIHTAGYRSLKFLERYESVESDIIINAARLIFAKKDYSPFIVNIYFSLIFNRHHCEPKSVIQKFAKDLQLLEEIYLFESVHDRLADADGSFLKELCCCRKAFAKDYIDTLLLLTKVQ